MQEIHRVTSTFIQAIPSHIKHFDGFLIAEVKTKTGERAILDPCVFNWDTKTIDINLPQDRNPGIVHKDLEESFFESVEAAFLVLMNAMA